MEITRAQVNAALEALGLDPNLTNSITITSTHVHSSVVALIDGYPDIKHGQTLMEHDTTEITGDAPSDVGDTP